ncbi:DUF6076 domain-containing protein [Dysosmobacter welbionis]|uniref:DUF6076 domain-containing protein n=1 Tax=Dysosmobacter welbionis TaxID=2093857 RepID=UPI0032BFA502
MADLFDKFSVFFTADAVYVAGRKFPLGQFTTDILNLDDAVLAGINSRIDDFMSAATLIFTEKADSAVHATQEKLNAVWDMIFELPLYRELEMDLDTAHHLFPLLFSDQEKWAEALNVDSEGHTMLEDFLNGLEYLPQSLRNLRGQVTGMLELYFEPLARRSADAYASAYAQYFTDVDAAGQGLFGMPPFGQSFPTEVSFVPVMGREEGARPVLAEKLVFSYLTHFLYTEFYRGLIAGNAPRQCQNCGRYFLLTRGYNTCYCNGIAPGETERTCRKVGAHRKEARGRADRSPAQVEYGRVYNRLKQRKNRGKISVDEWNTAVARAMEVLEQAGRGELTDDEVRLRFAEF